jgi:hypothetical protein
MRYNIPIGGRIMINNVSTISNKGDYSKLMVLLDVTRDVVKSSFSGSLKLYDNVFQLFVDDLCKNTALALWRQGYDKASIQSFMDISDERYDAINELIHDDYLSALVTERLSNNPNDQTAQNQAFSQSEIMSAFGITQEDLDNAEDDGLL